MSKFSLSYDAIHSVRLEVIGDRGLDTTVRVNRPVGNCVAVHFGASRSDPDAKEGTILVEGAPTGDGDVVVPFPAEPEFLRYAIFEGAVATGSTLVRRSGRFYLTVRSLLGLVDSCETVSGEEPVLHPGVTEVEVFIRGQRVAGARTAAMARHGGLLGRTIIYDVYSRLRTDALAMREAEVKEADVTKALASHVPLWAVKGTVPKVDIVGEGPVKDGLTVRSEARQPYNARSFVGSEDYIAANALSATEVLAPERTQGKYSNLDPLFSRWVTKQRTNVIVGVGITSGALAKSLPECFVKGVSFLGILKYGNADRVDNIILPKDMQYNDPKIFDELLSFLGKTKEQVQILGVFYEALDDDEVSVEQDLKLSTNAKNRVAAAGGLLRALGRNIPFFVRVEDPSAADLAADWCTRVYWPANFSLVHPFFYFARIEEEWFQERRVSKELFYPFEGRIHEGTIIEAVVVRLRLGVRFSGDSEGFEYPLQQGDTGGGSAALQAFMQPNPNTAGQDALTSKDLLRIATRLGVLHEMCKRSEPGYGFKDQGSSSVPIEYFNSTYASKYMWEVAGQQAPTHRALRVAPLSALFSLLDDDVYRAFCLLAYVLLATCAPMHSYELHQRVAAVGFMTRLEALRRLRLETRFALDGSGGERVVSRGRVTERDVQAYAKELLVFKDTYVTKKTWAVINAYTRVGAKGTGAARAESMLGTSSVVSDSLATLWQPPEAIPQAETSTGDGNGRARGRGRGRGPGRAAFASRVYRGGRGVRGAATGQPL